MLWESPVVTSNGDAIRTKDDEENRQSNSLCVCKTLQTVDKIVSSAMLKTQQIKPNGTLSNRFPSTHKSDN